MHIQERQLIWLKPFHDHAENEPHKDNCTERQQAHFLGYEGSECAVVSLHNEALGAHDDGLREITVDQIEGPLYEDPVIRAETWQNAVYVQDAVNFGAILASFVQAVGEIKKSDEFKVRGFQVLEYHPLVTLYLDKLVSLAHGYVNWEDDRYGDAFKTAKALGTEPAGERI